MCWKLNLDKLSTTASSSETSKTFHEQENFDANVLDNSVMVDRRKTTGFNYPLDDFANDGVEVLDI